MALNHDVYEEKANALAMWIGNTVSEWAGLEHQIQLLMGWALGLENNDVVKFLAPAKTFKLVLDMTDIAVKSKIHIKGITSHWSSITSYIQELSGDRNFVAHTTIVPHVNSDPNTTNWAEATPKVGPSPLTFATGTAKIPPMDILEVSEIFWDIRDANIILGNFRNAVEITGPLPGKFYAAIQRRRPPRNERLANQASNQP